MFEAETRSLNPQDLCTRIETLTVRVMYFWKDATGWAPVEAAGLLNKSMLEWQASLSGSLRQWLSASSDGDLILAWANLGALVEGQLKLFLSVYYNDYASDVDAIRSRKGNLLDPDECAIEPLRQFFVKRIWQNGDGWNPYVQLVQRRRNAIHAFRSRDIGTFDEWREQLGNHLDFINEINDRLPYPDGDFAPRDF